MTSCFFMIIKNAELRMKNDGCCPWHFSEAAPPRAMFFYYKAPHVAYKKIAASILSRYPQFFILNF